MSPYLVSPFFKLSYRIQGDLLIEKYINEVITGIYTKYKYILTYAMARSGMKLWFFFFYMPSWQNYNKVILIIVCNHPQSQQISILPFCWLFAWWWLIQSRRSGLLCSFASLFSVEHTDLQFKPTENRNTIRTIIIKCDIFFNIKLDRPTYFLIN